MVVSDVHDYGGGYMFPKFEREDRQGSLSIKKGFQIKS